MDNHEEILDALTALGKNPNPQEIPQILEQYLKSVAKSGETLFPWSQLKPLILRKMELVILELRRNLALENIPTRPNVENVRFDVMHARIIDSLHKFNGAPFTIQRLCELLIEPKRHYKRSDKFMRGLEKNVLVVSTVDPFGRKVVCESGNKPVLNGVLDVNGSYLQRDGGLSVPLPPVPGWVNTPASTTAFNRAASNNHNKGLIGNNSSQNSEKEGEVSNSESIVTQQGDTLPVQSEEVVEETVVTMETGEVTSDAGEAMADRDGEEITEDREASSFSSSSSSSEELSTSSDSVENMHISPFGTETGMGEDNIMDEQRPWAAFAQNSKQAADASHLFSSSNQSGTAPETNESSNVTSSSIPTNLSPSSTSTSVPTTETTAATSLSEVDDVSPQTDSGNADQPVTEKADQSFGFDTVNPDSENCSTNSTLDKDKLVSSSSLSALPIVSTTNITTPSPTDNTSTTISTPTDPTLQVSSSGQVTPTYAQVVASSSTDNQPIHSSHPEITQTETCDSVTGLERLVGSMEPDLTSPETHLSSSSSSTSSSSSSQSATNSSNLAATVTPSLPEPSDSSSLSQQVLPSSTQSSCHGEPVSKRIRLSEDESSMEADCISTSEDLCMEESSNDENLPRKRPVAHSSMEVGDKGKVEDEGVSGEAERVIADSEQLGDGIDSRVDGNEATEECNEATGECNEVIGECNEATGECNEATGECNEEKGECNEATVTDDAVVGGSDSIVTDSSCTEGENEVNMEEEVNESEKVEEGETGEKLTVSNSNTNTDEAVAESTTNGNSEDGQ